MSDTQTNLHKLSKPTIRRQTHMHCMICFDIAESYNQRKCYKCGSIFKWSIPWKNEVCVSN